MATLVAENEWNQNTQDLRAETQGMVTFYHSMSTPGFWFNAGELEALVESGAHLELPEPKEDLALQAEYERGPKGCLRCGGDSHLFEMRSYIAHDVRMRACHVCHGRWIGHGSLRLLVQHSRYRGLRGLFRRVGDWVQPKPPAR